MSANLRRLPSDDEQFFGSCIWGTESARVCPVCCGARAWARARDADGVRSERSTRPRAAVPRWRSPPAHHVVHGQKAHRHAQHTARLCGTRGEGGKPVHSYTSRLTRTHTTRVGQFAVQCRSPVAMSTYIRHVEPCARPCITRWPQVRRAQHALPRGPPRLPPTCRDARGSRASRRPGFG